MRLRFLVVGIQQLPNRITVQARVYCIASIVSDACGLR
jgi:hypothetical protein